MRIKILGSERSPHDPPHFVGGVGSISKVLVVGSSTPLDDITIIFGLIVTLFMLTTNLMILITMNFLSPC